MPIPVGGIKRSHPFLKQGPTSSNKSKVPPEKEFYIPPVTLTKYSKSLALVSSDDKKDEHKVSVPKKMKKQQNVNPRAQLELAEQWLNNKLNSSFEDISIKLAPLNRAKEFSTSAGAADRLQMTPLEVDILRKIVVRENLLIDVKRLITESTDLGNCILEIVELVKAIRFQTLDIVEDISSWIHAQPNKRPFLYRGANYLVKMCSDLDFMDSYDEIIERFCFEFKMNPLAYRGGGNIITGFGIGRGNVSEEEGGGSYMVGSSSSSSTSKSSSRLQSILNMRSKISTYEGTSDGIEVSRLQKAERLIQQEFERRRGTGVPFHPLLSGSTERNYNNNNSVQEQGLPPSILTTTKPSGISYIEDNIQPSGLPMAVNANSSNKSSVSSHIGGEHTTLSSHTGFHLPNDHTGMVDTGMSIGTIDSSMGGGDGWSLASIDNPQSVQRSAARFHVGPHTLSDALASVESDNAYYGANMEAFSNSNMGNKTGKHGHGMNAKKLKPVVSSRKKKQEKMLRLDEESEELRNIEGKHAEKISDLTADCQAMEDKGTALEMQRKQALKKGRDVTAQKLALEISINAAEMIETNKMIKSIQREMYFVSTERDRKEKLLTKLSEDIKDEKRRKQLEIKLAAQIKNGGLFNALSKGLALGSSSESAKISSSSPAKITSSQTNHGHRVELAMVHSESMEHYPAGDDPSRSMNRKETEEVPSQFGDFTIEYDVYDMSMEDDSSVMGFQNDPASPMTVAEKRKMKRQEASALQSTADDTSRKIQEAAGLESAYPYIGDLIVANTGRGSAEQKLRIRQLSRDDPERFAAVSAVASVMRSGLNSAGVSTTTTSHSTTRTSRSSSRQMHFRSAEGSEADDEVIRAKGVVDENQNQGDDDDDNDDDNDRTETTEAEDAVAEMMTRMAFEHLISQGADITRNTVTITSLMKMDLVARLLHTGVLSHHAFEDMYRQAGGGHGAGLTFAGFETFLDLISPLAE